MHLTTPILTLLGGFTFLTFPFLLLAQTPLRVGVLYEHVQLSDLAGLDLLGHHTPEILAVNALINPLLAPLQAYAVPMSFLYISSNMNTTFVTPALAVQPTHTYATAPVDLDILLIGGPNPDTVAEESLGYMRDAVKKTKYVLTTCSGAMWLAKSGALDGKNATTNRSVLEIARKKWPGVKWLDQRWVIDQGYTEGAQIWTAGGAGCGIDMIIEFTDRMFNKKVVRQACVGLDFPYEGHRNQFYSEVLQPVEL